MMCNDWREGVVASTCEYLYSGSLLLLCQTLSFISFYSNSLGFAILCSSRLLFPLEVREILLHATC